MFMKIGIFNDKIYSLVLFTLDCFHLKKSKTSESKLTRFDKTNELVKQQNYD